jgi:hypothetical protein
LLSFFFSMANYFFCSQIIVQHAPLDLTQT